MSLETYGTFRIKRKCVNVTNLRTQKLALNYLAWYGGCRSSIVSLTNGIILWTKIQTHKLLQLTE